VAINLAAVGGATPTAYATPVIKAAAFVVPTSVLENQTVQMSDFRALSIEQVSIDVATATDDVAISFVKSVTDEVTVTDVVNRMFYGNIDFDPTDPDADPDPITMADTDAKSVGKTLTDAATATDTNAKTVGKVSSDSVSSTDAINTKHVGKSSSDTVTTNDTVNTIAVDRVSTDTVSATDAAAKELTRPDVADSVTTADTSFTSPGLGKTDEVTSADAINTFAVAQVLTDTPTATDSITSFTTAKVLTDTVEITDFLAASYTLVEDFDRTDADVDYDPVTATDTPVFAATKVLVDSVTMADDNVFITGKVLSDSASATDSISLLLVLGQSNPLYDFAFASDDKFTYFPVPGTINSHLIHQPLVNGEFVLTTDPNAGIVYTIRTESYSYMFAGYGLNENQLN
jgi:hypothetical protein